MRKFALVLFLWLSMQELLFAEENEKIEILAEVLTSTETTVTAKGNVVVHYGDSVVHASSAFYDKNKSLLTIKGKDIELLGYQGSKIHTGELTIHTESNKVTFDRMFLSDRNDIWIYSSKAVKQDDNLTFGASMMSSCDVNSSDWSLFFEDSHYDGQEHYMKMHDVKVYLWDIPVLYTPYLAFSTDRKRSSGFLFPSFGYSNSDGFVYEQPYYWAPSLSWDVEINPQIRTARGEGVYGTLRFADSPYSRGAIRAGYFRDKDDYVQEHNMLNETHYGLEALYDSTKLIGRITSLDLDIEDGLYVNATLLNDIDYINLQKSQLTHFGVVPLQESRVNYYLRNDDYYGGIYGKYFIDTRKENSDDTMQILPTVNFHRYLKPIFIDRLTYSADMTINNFHRKTGSTARQAEFAIPIEYSTPFLDDYLNLSLKEELYYTKLLFDNQLFVEDEYEYYNHKPSISLFSDLTKKYDRFVHTLQPSLTYSRPGSTQESPLSYEMLEPSQKEIFTLGTEKEQAALGFSQYFYDEAMGLKFFQRFSQSYLPDEEQNNLGNLENEMQYIMGQWRFYNDLIYSHAFDNIELSSSRITLYRPEYHISLGHTYKRGYSFGDQELIEEREISNDASLYFGYKATQRISLQGGVIYNLDNAYSTQWQLGGRYDKDCWNLAIALKEEIRPTITAAGTESISENSLIFQFNFVPFGGIGKSKFDQ